MQHATPTVTQRADALLAFVRNDETECGCPPEQLATADRFTHCGGVAFLVDDCPRVWRVRVMTIDEASDANVGTNHTFAHGGFEWVVSE